MLGTEKPVVLGLENRSGFTVLTRGPIGCWTLELFSVFWQLGRPPYRSPTRGVFAYVDRSSYFWEFRFYPKDLGRRDCPFVSFEWPMSPRTGFVGSGVNVTVDCHCHKRRPNQFPI